MTVPIRLGLPTIELVDPRIDPEEVERARRARAAELAGATDTQKLVPALMDPAIEAGRMLAAQTEDGLPKLRYWSGTFWYWSEGRYYELPISEVRALIVNHLNANYAKIGTSAASNTLEQLRAQSILSSRIQPPSWLRREAWETEDIVATTNAIVHLPSFAEGANVYAKDATPAYFTMNAVDYRFEREQPDCPRWKQFLHELWPNDQQSIELLQDWFGYCLTPDTRQQKILMLIGSRRSGKGTIARVLTGVVGNGNVCGPTLASLQTNFGLSPLLGKSLAIISDARLSGRSDQAVITERLLAISGEDSQTVDRKYLEPVTTKLLARFMIVSNELPRLQDASGALTGRMLVLKLTESFYGRENQRLTEALSNERSGILHWAIAGWKRLRERGYFMQPESGACLREQLDELSSPISAFVKDRCELGAGYQIECKELYRVWCEWCAESGRQPGAINVFGKDLGALRPEIAVTNHRLGAHRVRKYNGIRLAAAF